MEGFIREWVKYGLVIWYKANGDKWLQFPRFRQNQPKLRYDRETPSSIPPPEKGKLCGRTPDSCRGASGVEPGRVRIESPPIEDNISEVNIREENLSDKPENPEQAPSKKTKPDESNSPSGGNRSKPKDKQLAELAAHLKTEDPREYKKFLQQHPDIEDVENPEVPWPP